MITTKFETWLPVFPGFYNTIFEPDLDDEFEELKREGRIPADEKYPIDRWDNLGYELAVVQNVCDVFAGWFPEEAGIEKCEFEAIKSPKEYNFGNDAVDVAFHIDVAKFAPWITAYLKANAEAWADDLRRYNSRDGFISYYTSDMDEWNEALARLLAGESPAWVTEHGFRSRQCDSHILGRVLEFWCEQEVGDTVYKMYYDGTEDVYVGQFINLDPATT